MDGRVHGLAQAVGDGPPDALERDVCLALPGLHHALLRGVGDRAVATRALVAGCCRESLLRHRLWIAIAGRRWRGGVAVGRVRGVGLWRVVIRGRRVAISWLLLRVVLVAGLGCVRLLGRVRLTDIGRGEIERLANLRRTRRGWCRLCWSCRCRGVLLGCCRRGGLARATVFCGVADILGRHTTADAGACDRVDIDAEVAGESAYGRCGERLAIAAAHAREGVRNLTDDRSGVFAFFTLSCCGLGCGLGGRCVIGAAFVGHEDRPDLDDVAIVAVQGLDLARARRGNLDQRLVGLHLGEDLVLLDLVAFADDPLDELGFFEPLTKVGEDELVRIG